MTFASRVAQADKPRPLYTLEFDGDLPSDQFYTDWITPGTWTPSAQASNVAVETVNIKDGQSAIKWDKSGTGASAAWISTNALDPIDWTGRGYFTAWVHIPDASKLTSSTVSFRYYLGAAGNYVIWNWNQGDLVDGFNLLEFGYQPSGSAWVASEAWGGSYRTYAGSPWTYYGTASWTYGLMYVNLDSAATTMTDIVFGVPRWHPHRISSGAITVPRLPYKAWMDTPSISPHVHDPVTAVISSASAQALVVDDDTSTIITDMRDFAMQNRGVTIRAGFAGDNEGDDLTLRDTNFPAIFRGRVSSFEHRGKAWTFSMTDNLHRFQRPFAQNASEATPRTISGNAITAFLRTAISNGSGWDGTYDDRSAAFGAAIPSDLFDLTAIENTRDEWRWWATCSYTFDEPQPSLLAFFFEVCLSFALVPVVTGDGKLSMRAPEEGLYPNTSLNGFDATNIIADALPSFRPNSERIRNQVRVLYDYNLSTDEYDSDTGNTYQLADSVARYGLRELVIPARGIVSASVAAKVCTSHLYRLGDGSPPIELQLTATEQQREMGEVVQLTSGLAPDLDAASYSSSASLGVIETIGFDPAAQRVTASVGRTSYRLGKYRLIHATGAANYDSQTQATKDTYGSVSDSNDQLGAANDPTHEVGA